MPFITEEIWQRLRNQGPEGSESISLAAFPLGDASRHDAAAEREMGILQDIITSVRTLRAEMKVDPKLALNGVLYSTTGAVALAEREQEAISKLANVKLELKAEAAPKTGAGTRSTPDFDLVLMVPAAQQDAQMARLRKENEQLEKNIANTERQLGDEKFMGKAPAHIVASMRQKLEEYRTQLVKNQDALRSLEG
jgi:valyl-tRNA synthetase